MTDFISLYRASKIFIQGTFCQWNLRTTNEASQCVMGPIRMPSLFPFCNGWGPQSWNVQELCNLKFPWMVHVVENVHFAIKRYFKYEKLRILWFFDKTLWIMRCQTLIGSILTLRFFCLFCLKEIKILLSV